MDVLIGFSLLMSVLMLVLFPLIFAELMAASLVKLHLSPETAVLLIIGIIVGGFINIPVKRLSRTEDVLVYPYAAFGIGRGWPRLQRYRRDTIIAVNVGGCVIPVALALYELVHLHAAMLLAVTIIAAVNIVVCYRLARPVAGVGITLPGLVPALVAAILALLLAPGQAAPVAFIAGIAGPLVGADLLHLKDISKMATGAASIGGAGTFDGIVLSGIVAAYLA
jgi:uncharacterized membrane protein